MDSENCFGRYALCDKSLEKLSVIKDRSANNDSKMRDAWRVVSWEESEEATVEKDIEANVEDAGKISGESLDGMPESTQATQYGLTQIPRSNSSVNSILTVQNITELLYESLERANGKLDIDLIQNISNSDLTIVMNNLSKKLSHKGIYNLCHMICGLNIELSERYISFTCRDVLLPAIIATEEPSRLLNAAITEYVGKCPEDVRNFIFIPVLNSDLKEISTLTTITSILNVQQKHAYICDMSSEVKELKHWHIPILQDLLVPSLEDGVKEKVLNMLCKISYEFSNDKHYGKLVLNLLKTNAPTTVQQKYLFEEIVMVHNTLFKRLMEKILETLVMI